MKPLYVVDKKNYLLESCNKYGDFFIQTKIESKKIITKWVSVLECWENIGNSKFVWRLNTATDRTLFPCEVVLDVDPKEKETKEELKERVKKICLDLNKRNVDYISYISGGNGFHIHIIIWDLALYNKPQRENFRSKILSKYECDTNLKSDRHMILLEGSPNRKTGISKKEVEI